MMVVSLSITGLAPLFLFLASFLPFQKTYPCKDRKGPHPTHHHPIDSNKIGKGVANAAKEKENPEYKHLRTTKGDPSHDL
jgi:hypothetical protein